VNYEKIFREELKKEFEQQLNVQINHKELENVMKQYKKIKKFQKTRMYVSYAIGEEGKKRLTSVKLYHILQKILTR